MTATDAIDFEEDANAPAAPDDGMLKTLAGLCENALAWDKTIGEAEEQLRKMKAERDELYNRVIPDAMLDCGMTKFTLASGHGVEVQDIIAATPKADNRPLVYDWLRTNGFGDLVKNEVTASFGAGDDAVAESVLLYLEEQHLAASRKESVHPQTLNAFVREQLRKGTPIPEDLFGVYRGRVAKIK